MKTFSELCENDETAPGDTGCFFRGGNRVASDIFLYESNRETSLGHDADCCASEGESGLKVRLLLRLLQVEFLEFDRHN